MSNNPMNNQEIKEMVRQRYSEIALQDRNSNAASCCGAGPVSGEVYTIMSDSYEGLPGHVAEADLGLGCGLPVQFADLSEGCTVIDLGSGAGNDAFVARGEVGPSGTVFGIDFSPTMIEKARTNARNRGLDNVHFIEADIDSVPLPGNLADVVVSNCVLNLLPDKTSIFREIFRLLKPGGHFSISDVVRTGVLPDALLQEAEMYAGCVSGASERSEYLELIAEAGFEEVVVQREKPIALPQDILQKYLSESEAAAWSTERPRLMSVTVFGRKPLTDSESDKTRRKVSLSKPRVVLTDLSPTSSCAPGSSCC